MVVACPAFRATLSSASSSAGKRALSRARSLHDRGGSSSRTGARLSCPNSARSPPLSARGCHASSRDGTCSASARRRSAGRRAGSSSPPSEDAERIPAAEARRIDGHGSPLRAPPRRPAGDVPTSSRAKRGSARTPRQELEPPGGSRQAPDLPVAGQRGGVASVVERAALLCNEPLVGPVLRLCNRRRRQPGTRPSSAPAGHRSPGQLDDLERRELCAALERCGATRPRWRACSGSSERRSTTD